MSTGNVADNDTENDSGNFLFGNVSGCGGKDTNQTPAPAADNKAEDTANVKADDTVAENGDTTSTSGTGKVYYLNFKPEQKADWE